jgi:hypothetical protein
MSLVKVRGDRSAVDRFNADYVEALGSGSMSL